MPLCPMREILTDAIRGRYAVGYFEPWDQYSMEAVIEAAEALNAPVIIGCGGIMMDQDWFNAGGMEVLACMAKILARRSKVPTALLLNEVSTIQQIEEGLKYGFNAVMLDTSHLSFEENVRLTKKVVALAHKINVDVEAELGHLPLGTGESENTRPSLTDPQQAVEFVQRTGVDALAVSIGNIHVLLKGKSEQLDFNRLEQIHRLVKIPLVIHGSTGFPDEAISRAIELGVAKFNVGTILKRAYWKGLKEAVAKTRDDANPQYVIGSRKPDDILACASEKMRSEVERLIRLFMRSK